MTVRKSWTWTVDFGCCLLCKSAKENGAQNGNRSGRGSYDVARQFEKIPIKSADWMLGIWLLISCVWLGFEVVF
jgi:hypothetical protein